MVTTFETMMQAGGWDVLAGVHGLSVTHTPDGADAAAVIAIWQPNSIMASYVFDGEQEVETGILTVNAADVTMPTLCDTFTINDEIWAVAHIGATTPYVELQLVKRTQTHVGGADQRLER